MTVLFDREEKAERPVIVDAGCCEGFGDETGLLEFQGDAEMDEGMKKS